MHERTSVDDQRDSGARGPLESGPEAASSCTEIGCEDDDMKWPIAEMVGTAVFVVVVCFLTAAVIAWIV